jgi:hypothetical protein
MKQLPVWLFAFALVSRIGALDVESIRFVDRLMAISEPVAPQLFDDAVIFTASARQRRVGVSFAHEGFGKIHWFKKLESPNASSKGAGVLFLAYEYPRHLKELEYRLIADGLWTVDPWNLPARMDGSSGIGYSVVALPAAPRTATAIEGADGALRFYFETAAGESVYVAGSFNNWDPFMYELREESPGRYSLVLPLPGGTHRYAFFHRGERVLDPFNPRKVYAKDGKTASEIVVE